MTYRTHPKITLGQVLQSLCPYVQWSVEDNSKILWKYPNDPKVPTTDMINEHFDQMIADYEANLYKDLRKTEYDKLNQLEMQFDDMQNGTTTWIDAINLIKKRYPKGSTS